ncbi:MAG: hypothetical protein J6J18_04285 [Oscillospiraceae bacterium]|nr:hypothetical protein [Oscillospiraceae bacterium]
MKKKILLVTAVILAVTAALLFLLFANGIIVFDHSGRRRGEGVFWNGSMYIPCSGEYSEGKTIAKTEDGWRINEVEEDDSHAFIVMRSFLDQYLLVKEDYQIPTEGRVTSAVWGKLKITDEEFLTAISELISQATSDYSYETEGIFQSTEGQQMRNLCVAFENCPVATQNLGYMGTIGGTWYITTEISSDQYNEDGSPKAYTVWCYTIPNEYIPTLEKYLK